MTSMHQKQPAPRVIVSIFFSGEGLGGAVSFFGSPAKDEPRARAAVRRMDSSFMASKTNRSAGIFPAKFFGQVFLPNDGMARIGMKGPHPFDAHSFAICHKNHSSHDSARFDSAVALPFSPPECRRVRHPALPRNGVSSGGRPRRKSGQYGVATRLHSAGALHDDSGAGAVLC